jgi:hypothetical protein
MDKYNCNKYIEYLEYQNFLDDENTTAVVVLDVVQTDTYGIDDGSNLIYANFIPNEFDLEKTKTMALDIFKNVIERTEDEKSKYILILNPSCFHINYKKDPIYYSDGISPHFSYSLPHNPVQNSIDCMFEISFLCYRCYAIDKEIFRHKIYQGWFSDFRELIHKHSYDEKSPLITKGEVSDFLQEYIQKDLANIVAEYTGYVWYFGETNYVVCSNVSKEDKFIFDDGYCCFDIELHEEFIGHFRSAFRSEFKNMEWEDNGELTVITEKGMKITKYLTFYPE